LITLFFTNDAKSRLKTYIWYPELRFEEEGGNARIMGAVADRVAHSSPPPPIHVAITTAKGPPPRYRAVSHRRAGHEGDDGERAVPDIDKDQLQCMVLVDEG
jgi:hypothetical protein